MHCQGYPGAHPQVSSCRVWGFLGLLLLHWWARLGTHMADYSAWGVPVLVSTHWWKGKPLAIIAYMEESKILLASTSVPNVE